PHGSQHRTRDHRASLRNRIHRWSERSFRQHRSNGRDSESRSRKFHRSQRRRRAHASSCRSRRQRNHLRSLKRNSRGNVASRKILQRSKFPRRAKTSPPISSSDGRKFHRVQSHSGKSRNGPHGSSRSSLAPAARSAQTRKPREN